MITDEFDIYFSTDFFAVSATYTAQGTGATPQTITGIFTKEYIDDAGGAIGVEGNVPVFHTKTASVPNATQGDSLVIGSTTYKIANVQPDGTGETVLILEEQ